MTLSRRRFLSTATLGTGALAAPWVRAQATSTLTFAFAPDESGAIQGLIDAFNAGNGSGIEVIWTQAPENSDDFLDFMRSEFRAGATGIDLFGADVIWTAEMAARGWLREVPRGLIGDIGRADLLGPALDTVAWRNRTWAVPWYTDVGLLYYRRDLLEEAGLSGPPSTWDDLAEAASAVMEQSGLPHGLVLQGAQYEGGTTNALEVIWSAGGRAWTGEASVSLGLGLRPAEDNVIVLDTADSIAGMAKMRELVEAGVIPEAVTTMNERDSLQVFGGGEAVFMRNWPFAYGLLGSGEFGDVTPDQVGAAPIPTLRPGMTSYSCLGGWNLAVPVTSRDANAAWEFVRFALAPEQQRAMAEAGGFMPVRPSLYEDDDLSAAAPVVALAGPEVLRARARPSSPFYADLSPRLAIMFGRILRGELPADEAVPGTARELRNMIDTI